MTGTPALWLAVIASGLYHGLSPGMGWPLAVSAALFERRAMALLRALLLLALGHLAAMTLVLVPFALLDWLVPWSGQIRLGAGLFVVAVGLWKLFDQRHPRGLARIKPAQLALWSFFVALAHGAGLLLVPIFLGMTARAHAEHMMQTGLAVAIVHTLAMLTGAAALSFAVYRWLGLSFLKKSWFNLDTLWAASLILAGGVGVWSAMPSA